MCTNTRFSEIIGNCIDRGSGTTCAMSELVPHVFLEITISKKKKHLVLRASRRLDHREQSVFHVPRHIVRRYRRGVCFLQRAGISNYCFLYVLKRLGRRIRRDLCVCPALSGPEASSCSMCPAARREHNTITYIRRHGTSPAV